VTDSEAKEVAMIAAEMEAAAMEAAAIEAAATDAEAADAEAAGAEAADATEVQAEVVVATPPRQVEPLAKRTPERGPPPPSPAVRMAAVQAAAAFLLAAEAEAEEEEEEEAETDWTPTRPEAVSEEEANAKRRMPDSATPRWWRLGPARHGLLGRRGLASPLTCAMRRAA
jgi:hypothetical protein